MADDDGWASWKPTTSTAAAANDAFENRKALSRSGSAPLAPNAALAAGKKHLAPGALAFENAFTPEATPAPGWGNRGQKRGRSRSPPPSARDGGRAGPSRFSDRQEEGPARPPAASATRDERSPHRAREADRDRRERPVERERDSRNVRDARTADRERERPRERSRDRERERERDHRGAGRDGPSERARDSRRDDARPPPRASSRERRDARPDDRRDRDARSNGPRQDARDVKPDARAVASAKANGARDVVDARSVKPVVADLAAQAPASQKTGHQEANKASQASASASASALNLGSIKGAASGRTVLVKNLADGTTEGDIEATFAECGKISSCRESKELRKQSVLAFEITYVNAHDADRAIREFNGIEADGKVIEVSHYTVPATAQAPPSTTAPVVAATVAPIKTKIDDIQVVDSPMKTSNSDRSLLSRLSGVPASATDAPKSAKGRNKQINGNGAADDISSRVLAPFDGLLKRAGVDSLATLRKLVRPGTVREYVEMLSQEYPNEPLLDGLTAKWALRERLEEWLGEKQQSTKEWGNRP